MRSGASPLNADTRQIFFYAEKVRGAALHDLQQRVHRRNLFELLRQEPLEKVICDKIVLGTCQFDQRVNLMSYLDFLRRGQLDGFLRCSRMWTAARQSQESRRALRHRQRPFMKRIA